jgi:hypothetical protein
MRLLSCVLFLAATIAFAAPPDDGPAAKAAQDFYAWVLAHPDLGLPRGKNLHALEPMLTRALAGLLRRAIAAEDGYAKAAPKDEKPDMFEGDMFVDNYEGATEVSLAKPESTPAGARVEAKFFYVDPRFPKAHPFRTVAWTDHAVLVHRSGHWLVDDIEYDPAEK